MTMHLRRLQTEIARIYDVDVRHSVEDFVCSAESAAVLAPSHADRPEALVVVQHEEGAEVGLYVDEATMQALATLAPAAWTHDQFSAFCTALEGVSHFVLLAFRAEFDHAVRELELELQAEVDKYAASLLAGNGVGLMQARSGAIRQRLFERVSFLDAPGTERGDRYRAANRAAARFAEILERRFVAAGDERGLVTELRRFYRLGLEEKLRASEG